jgi:hypothetical protein
MPRLPLMGPGLLALPLALVMSVLMGVSPLRGQWDATVLADINSVEATVDLHWDERIRGLNGDAVQRRLQTVFELELRQYGVTIARPSPPAFLILSLQVLHTEDIGLVAFSYDLSLREGALSLRVLDHMLDNARGEADPTLRSALLVSIVSDLHVSKTWRGTSGLATVGRAKLEASLEQVTREAAQAFANAYLANRRH